MAERLQEALADCLQKRNYSDIVGILDRAELQSDADQPLTNWPHALHLLSHIYRNNLEDARFLWKRIPQAAKQGSPELQAIFRLLQCMWNRNYQATWQSLSGFAWSEEVAPVMQALAERLREEMLQLLAQAFQCIELSKAAALLGTSDQAASELALQQGWQLDPGTGMIKVTGRHAAEADWDGMDSLKQLSEYMIHLEQ